MTFESVVNPRSLEDADAATPSGAYGGEVDRLRVFLGESTLSRGAASGLPSWLKWKRAVDLVLGAVMALAALPMIVLLAVVVAISLRGWPLFIQQRVGQYGRVIRCPKLRTLPRHAPRYASKYEIDLPTTGVLGFLRRRHLDELPQLLLVPIGKLSLVGPRPKMPHEFEPAPDWYVEARTVVPQGCSGLWQVGNHTHEMPHESPEYDLFYLRHFSLRLDLWILWRTFRKVVGLGRPVELRDIPAWVHLPAGALLTFRR